jgi:hypothetical protein
MGTGSRSDSSKSYTGEDVSTGTAAATRAELREMTRDQFEAYVRGEPTRTGDSETIEVTLTEYFQPLITTPLTVGQSAEVQREEGSPNDCEFGWRGFHYWQSIPFAPEGTRKCLMCGRVRT